MATYSPMPDIEAVVCAALKAADVCGGRVYTEIPKTPVYPLTVVQRLGGIPRNKHRIDAPRIQVDVWADDKATARDEADDARLTVHELEGSTSSTFNAAVTAVDDESGLLWLPDSDTGRPRYTFSVVITAHDFQDN